MKTLSQIVAEAHGNTQPDYLKHTLIGRDEIGRFAAALRNEVLDEAIRTTKVCGTAAEVASALEAMKGTA